MVWCTVGVGMVTVDKQVVVYEYVSIQSVLEI